MDYQKTEVKSYMIEALCDSCGGVLEFYDHYDDGFDHRCVECNADRYLSEKFPKIVYEKVGEPELI